MCSVVLLCTASVFPMCLCFLYASMYCLCVSILSSVLPLCFYVLLLRLRHPCRMEAEISLLIDEADRCLLRSLSHRPSFFPSAEHAVPVHIRSSLRLRFRFSSASFPSQLCRHEPVDCGRRQGRPRASDCPPCRWRCERRGRRQRGLHGAGAYYGISSTRLCSSSKFVLSRNKKIVSR